MTFRLLALLMTLGVLVTSPAASQTAEQLMLLQANPGLAQQLQGQLGKQAGSGVSEGAGVPTSGETQVLNANDATADPSLLTQSIAPKAREDSVIQRYYRILAGDVLPIYGAAEFTQSQDTQLLFFNTMGKEYRLAAGDVLRVTLRGLTESDASYKIGRDGNLILPGLAPFSVAGLTIKEAETKLLDVLRYDDASAAVYMSLETARLITVQVSGAVTSPRTIAVPAYTPLSRVLAYAGGIKPTGSLRNIVLRDRDGSVNQVDFYDFLQSPEGANDPLVTDSSRVFIGNQGNTVAAVGFVARPGIYEMPDGETSIAVDEILALTGTRILPPGLELEALYFDTEGLAQSRELKSADRLQPGEVLSIRFLPTRLTDSIRIKGAVLEDYQLATAVPISVRDLLRGGATLTEEASRNIALIVGERATSRVIDLENALLDPKVTVSPGEVMHIFTPKELRDIARSDINASDSNILRGFVEAEAAELFLNGERLSFLPIGKTKLFEEIVRPFYRVTPKTNLDLAILEGASGNAKAVSLRALLLSNEAFVLEDGAKIHLFDNQFLQISANVLKSPDAEGDILKPQSEDWQQFAKLLNRAGVLRVYIDGELRAFLPQSETLSLATTLDVLGFENLNRFADFILLEKTTSEVRQQIELRSLAGDIAKELPRNVSAITFYSAAGKQDLLSQADQEEFDAIASRALNLYLDYQQVDIGIARDLTSPNSALSQKISLPEIYPLFAIYEYFDADEGFWEKQALSVSDIKAERFIAQIEPGARLTIFTKDFLADLLGSGSGSGSGSDATQQLLGLQVAGLADVEQDGENVDQEARLAELLANAQQENNTTETNEVLSPNLEFILSASRYVAGAVERPGYYPVAGRLKLSQLLAAAGGLTENADIARLEVIKQKVSGGKIIADRIDPIDLTKSDASELTLSDRYSLNVPALINDVATGLVTLSGEVQRPGDYLIARDETLHDLIKRAGGLTDVAYPLGAVFTRESLKDSQRDSNALLAGQLEQAVLQVAQSDVEGAGEQVNAVLGYAQQLRLQEVTGRLSVNVSLEDGSAPVYLQDGDVLTIPKRPAHVSVIGSVQKDTVASYSAGKRLGSYLAAAGGVNRIADIKRTYILLPNGESTSADEESIIPPGAVIVVPPKTDRLTVLGLTDLVSRVLGNIATSVLAINNVR